MTALLHDGHSVLVQRHPLLPPDGLLEGRPDRLNKGDRPETEGSIDVLFGQPHAFLPVSHVCTAQMCICLIYMGAIKAFVSLTITVK